MVSVPSVRPVNDGLHADLEVWFQLGYYWPIEEISFYFRDSSNPPATFSYVDDQTPGSFRSLGERDRIFVREMLDYASRIFDLTFTESSTQSGSLSFGSHHHTKGGYANSPHSSVAVNKVDIEGNSDYMEGGKFADYHDHPGRFTYGMLLHEVGHALGLPHIQEINGFLSDSVMGSVVIGRSISFGAYDILALQEIYGAVIDSTNDRYYLRSSDPEVTSRVFEGDVINLAGTFCLYDGGGINTIDLSLNDAPSVLDLRPGSYSIVGVENADKKSLEDYNLSIAYNSKFYDVIGSNAGDVIFGNDLANFISCGSGNDSVAGLAGDDIVDGGGGTDVFIVQGNRAEYSISRVGATVHVKGPDGRDELRNVEVVQFDDATADILDRVRPVDDIWFRNEGHDGAVNFSFLISLPDDVDTSISRTISYSISGWGDHPAGASDFSGGIFPSGMLTFAPGETSRTLSVDIAGDLLVEADESFGISLSDATTGQTFKHVLATATIKNDDQASVRLSAPSVRELEGSSGTTAFTFFVELERPSAVTETLFWVVGKWSDVNVPDATDFVGSPFSGAQITFAPGETTKTITVGVAGDAAVEPDELFYVFLHAPSAGLTIVSGLVERTILDDDSLRVHIVDQSASRPEGDTGATALSFSVFLTQATSFAQSVRWSVSGSQSWVNGADFAGGVLPSGVVTFEAGETVKTILVEVNADRAFEGNDKFSVTLSDPSAGLSIGTAVADGTIVNDDSPFYVSALSSHVEGDTDTTEFTFIVYRLGIISVPDSISWSVAGSGPNPATASDFANGIPPSGTVTFAPGESSRTISVLVAGDNLDEVNEEFTVTLSNPSVGPATGEKWSVTSTIFDDDVSVSLQPTATIKSESQAGANAFTFILTLSAMASERSVAWAVTGDGAAPSASPDFVGGLLPSGVVTFGVGQTSRTITVNVQGDTAVEADEGFIVTLSSPSAGLTIATSTASGTIVNDDATVSIAASEAVEAEGQAGSTAFTFTLTRSGATANAHSVQWMVTGAGATPAGAADFAGGLLPTGTVTFAAGETSKVVTVNVAGDTTAEANESFFVTLSNPSPGLVVGTASAMGTIQNDDTVPPVVAHGDAYVVLRGQVLMPPAVASVLANDESAAAALLLDDPDHGTLQLVGSGTFSYTPAAGFHGIDTFAYRAGNAGSTVDEAQVTILVVPVQGGASTTLNLLALDAGQQIAATYIAFFGRGADAGGLDFWVGEFNRGLPVQGPAALFANIASSFAISPEGRALYPFLANPFGAGDGAISAFLDEVYDNLFNRSPDAAGLSYWTDQIKQTLQSGQFVGSVLINIMSGAQDTAVGKDITTLMGKVAVSLAYVQEQKEHDHQWKGPSDVAAATALLDPVTSDAQSVLVGVRNAESLIATVA